MTTIAEPIFTHTFDDESAFAPNAEALYLYTDPLEERGSIEVRRRRLHLTKFVEVSRDDNKGIVLQGDSKVTIPARAGERLRNYFECLPATTEVLLDITSMNHGVWAPLIRACAATSRKWSVVYSEPIQYKLNRSPTEGDIYDLSERIEGIASLPGFARIRRSPREDVCFVPLLGFEGTRFAHIREAVQPPGDKIVPIIGVPGFRPEFPFATLLGNRLPLMETRSWKRICYAQANCPFSLYWRLVEIKRRYPNHVLKIAPIGTKPHALGAVLFALHNPDDTELIYDHPVRKSGRTTGKARLLVYAASDFCER